MTSQLCPPFVVLNRTFAAEVERSWIDGREQERRGAQEPVLPAAHRFGSNVLHLPGAAIELLHLAAIDDVRVQRVGGDIAVLLGPDGVPIAGRDLAVVAAAGDAGRAALLLAAVHPVRKPVIGDDVVELGGRLVVPATPRLAAVDRDDRALVGRDQQDDVRIVRVDPDRVIVVAAG